MKARILPILLSALIFAAPLSGCIFTNDTPGEIISEDSVTECPDGTELAPNSDVDCIPIAPIVIDSDDDAVDSSGNSTTEAEGNETTSANETQDSTNDTEQETAPLPLAEQCLDSHQNLAMHIHPYLDITVRDIQVVIPADMGIDTTACSNKMHLLHTHDQTGKLHIETYEEMTVNLTLFFEVWNISEVTNHELHPLFIDPANVSISINGVIQNVDWHLIALLDGDQVAIEFDDAIPDTDGDGVNDQQDICPGHDDHIDADEDGIPDGCDDDDDGDGVSDDADLCPGYDDTMDSDSDGIPDGCDSTDDSGYDASDLALFWMDKFLCQNGTGTGIDDYNTTGDDNHVCEVTVATDDNNVTITMNGIPNHDLESGPGCCATAQSYTLTIPREPVNDTTGGHSSTNCPSAGGNYQCAADRGSIAYGMNGVPFFGPEDGPGGDAVAYHHGEYEEDRQQIWLGIGYGHSAGGTYHYHADANLMHWHPNETANEGWLDYSFPSSLDSQVASPVIGVAFDGYPIYGIYGDDGNGLITEMKSSYQLKAGETGYNGIDDYEYVAGLGDLDVCNGHFGPTPDFPQGIYHYHSTIENGMGEMGFPYFLICYHGEVPGAAGSGGGGDDPCAGYGETWGPGIGPPPAGCGGGGGQGTQSAETMMLTSTLDWSSILLGLILLTMGINAFRRYRR
ncbi:MAG TPA: YHYH protein [Candidatus Thalassarchaeaceae archaeon]|nr:MAG TPA: YHYH protein [Candidatus Poseidoniales archaeon]HIH84368.1 YHYH protein [Candidatus Thalassarchaeaceae archaeon]